MPIFKRLFGKKEKKKTEPTLASQFIDEPSPDMLADQFVEEAKFMQQASIEKKEKENEEPKENVTAKKKEYTKKEAKQKITSPADQQQPSEPEIINAEQYDIEVADKINDDAGTKKVKVKGFGGVFEIKKSKDGRFVFNLYAANRVIVATSQIYSSSQSAINGINSVITNAEKASVEDQTLKTFTPQSFPKWEIYLDKAGQFRFRLLASNASCICHSQGYTQKSTCKKGIESIIRTVKSAEIDKAYLKR